MTASALSGIVGPTHWQRTAPHFIETVRPMAWQARLRSTPLDAARLRANATQRQAVRVISGGLRVHITLLCSEGWSHRHHAAQGTVPQPVACEVRSSPSVRWATSIRALYIFELVASVASRFGIRRTWLHLGLESVIGSIAEIRQRTVARPIGESGIRFPYSEGFPNKGAFRERL